MTAYGESITQKEILTDSYFVHPGFLPENDLIGLPKMLVDTGKLEMVQPNRYVLNFSEFYFQHYALPDSPAVKSKLNASADFVLMHFCLTGNSQYADEDKKKIITFKPTEYNVLSIPQNQELLFSSEAGKLEIVNIYLERSFISKYIPADHVLSPKFKAKSLENFNKNNLALSPQIQGILHNILNCGFEGHLRKLFIQAKIIELLVLQMAQFEEEKKDKNSLKQSDIDKMMLVKNIIESNLNESFSLSHLAKEVVTNEQYLKKHFKMVFGSTVFNYILRCRMEKAKEMLLTGEHKIAEVAEHTGYKHATHFTNAFKKYFGYLPNHIKA